MGVGHAQDGRVVSVIPSDARSLHFHVDQTSRFLAPLGMTGLRVLRLLAATVVFAASLYGGAHRFAPAPALGAFLDPAHGVWSLIRTADHAAASSAQIAHLGADVQIVYDDRAVPHIFATSEEDAYRAMGWVVARDRLFQMYLQTMAATGRLTELAGARALPLDREMRRLGLPRAAERALAAADTAAFMHNARAYAEGVNAYVREMPKSELPLEFRLTGTQPFEWTPLASFHLFGRMGWTLAYLSTETERSAAASRVGVRAAEALFPDAYPIQEPIQPNGQHAPRMDFQKLPPPGAPDTTSLLLASAVDAFLPSKLFAQKDADVSPQTFASNNWAVSPSRSANGHALLEGDPHLELNLPSIWYEVHLVVPGKLDVYGVTIPGAPGIVIGFNRDVAWTFTNTGTDVLDYYAEVVDNDAHPTKYQVDGAWRPLEQRIEKYAGSHGQALATDTLYFTHRGPMRRVRDRWLSMRWTVLEAGRELEAFYGASHAKSANELEAAMGQSYFAPAQNMLSADRGGHIAIRSTGHYPNRPGDGKGNVVRDGSLSASDWTGFLPLSAYPQSVDPAQGYLASANQQPIDPKFAQGWWGGNYDPWRALRINALLRADSAMTPAKMQAFQTDPGSERANLFVPYFVNAARRHSTDTSSKRGARLAEAERILAGWDRRYTKENTAAVLFEEAMRTLTSAVWDELSDDGRRVATPSSGVLLELLADPTSVWWDDRSTSAVENRDDILANALEAAVASVHARYGEPGSAKWRWSNVRNANINHLLRLNALSALNLPVQGGPGTLSPSVGIGTHGPSWRMVVEMGPDVHAWATYPGGQSGRPLSQHYTDRLPLWLRGELEPIRFPRTPAEIDAPHRSSVVTLTAAH